MALQEYKVEDPNFGSRTFQWDKEVAGEVGFPKGAKLVRRSGVETESAPAGADPAPVVDSQEPDNKLDETARGQAHQADVDAAEKAAKQPDNKAADAPENKA